MSRGHKKTRTPYTAEDEFDIGVRRTSMSNVDGYSGLANDDGPDMVHDRNGRELGAVYQLKNIHRNQHLGGDDQDIAQPDHTAVGVRRLIRATSRNDGDKRVGGYDEDDDLGEAGYMVVYEAAFVQLAKLKVRLPI